MARGCSGTAAALVSSIPGGAGPEREFAFTDADFQSLVKLAYDHTGIALAGSKRNLVYSRLSRRLRSLGLRSFCEYREHLAANDAELEDFINAISTNLTRFFREPHHFEHLRSHVAVPFDKVMRADKRLRIWSAGCSTGEEPYTIAAVLSSCIRNVNHLDVRILATDIDTDVIAKGARGEYSTDSIDQVPKAYRELFRPIGGRGKPTSIVMGDDLRSLIAFRCLNLMEPWPFRGKFDAIFCRNVMIYFDGPTKSTLVDRFRRQLQPDGWLYIGHSESLIGAHPGLELAGRTTYRRVE